ncbi:Imidazoleglycerol-phosphate dehydratase [hydrothermal vent metagenome]|uniref:Imidazoleglycerol-phosphate dehydratase n=1 Tax=hydrothermal vent metagenome TaxID=652676 RepID=A0A3B0SJY7_9ZZZZ
MTRTATITRTTSETDIRVVLDLDGTGRTKITTGVGMYDHLLTSFGMHGLFDLEITTKGDLHIDEHHTVEDTAIALGQAFDEALGDRSGITRFADTRLPMDEAVAIAAIDLGGRAYTVLDLPFIAPSIGALGTQVIPHALEAFASSARMTLHLTATGRNDHHIAEASFKALARSMRVACELDPRRVGIPSTKGVL